MKTANFYTSDRPISSKRQDLLRRAPFAERLSQDIQSWRGEDSLVIALFGAWGSGKSSLKNMILESLGRKKSTRIPTLEFNPWQLSGTGNIPALFFQELGIVLDSEGPQEDVEERSKKWRLYSKLLTVIGTAVTVVGRAMQSNGHECGKGVEMAGGGLSSAGIVAKEGSDAMAEASGLEFRNLNTHKAELSKMLRRLPKPVLIVIDDIDRLTTEEILSVFQLVKANADFPNLIYLLLFEREIVSKALNQVSGGKGAEFLEKIIQVGYHIPHASRSSIQKALFDGLEKVIHTDSDLNRWDKRRWTDLFLGGVGEYFANLRHVNRFLASFTFHARHHGALGSFEVNPVDLIGLETLRVFEAGIYERLPTAKALLTRQQPRKVFGEISQDTIDNEVSQILQNSPEQNRNRVKAILQILFPPITPSYAERNMIAGDHNEWLRQLRVCHPDFFDKYFTLSIADDDISQTELDNLIEQTGDADRFCAACKALENRNLLKIAFQRLDAYKEEIPMDNMPMLIQALCNLSESFPEREPGLFEQDVNSLAWRLVYFGLKREPDLKTRAVVLQRAFKESDGLALPLEIVSLDERIADLVNRGHEFLIGEEDLANLKELCVEKIRRASLNPGFRDRRGLRITLWRWSDWGAEKEVRDWVAPMIQNPRGALWLLMVCLDEGHSFGREHRVHYFFRLSSIEELADVSSISSLVAKLDANDLSKREQIAIREFNDAIARRAAGQSDDAWRNSKGEVAD